LKEISNLIKEVVQDANRPNAKLSFKLVYIDNLRGKYAFKELGTIHNVTSSEHDEINLDDARFVIGDFLDVAIYFGPPPRPFNITILLHHTLELYSFFPNISKIFHF